MARVDNLNIDGTAYEIGKIASTTNLGVVQVGDGLSITSAGVLSATGGSPQQEATKLTMENLGTSTWASWGWTGAHPTTTEIGQQCEATMGSTDIQFIDEAETVVTLQNLWDRIENGEKFNITLPLGDIASQFGAGSTMLRALKMATTSNTLLDDSDKNTYSTTILETPTTIEAYLSKTTAVVENQYSSTTGYGGMTVQEVPFGILCMTQGEDTSMAFVVTIIADGSMSELG